MEDEILLELHLSLATTVAEIMHYGQKDKAGRPYIEHPRRVATAVRKYGIPARVVGLLHDVVEDTPMKVEDLTKMHFLSEITEAIDAISKRPGMTHREYAERVTSSKLATIVKIADIEDNMIEARLNEWKQVEPDHMKIDRYVRIKMVDLKALKDLAKTNKWLLEG